MATYRERVRWPGWLRLVLLLVWGGALAGLVSLVLRHGPRPDQLVALLILLVVGFVCWRLRYLDVEAGAAGAAYGFGGLRRHVPRDHIDTATAEDYPAVRYMGWGYRLGWDRGERACSVLGYRRGVRLGFRDERERRWNVFLSCRDPEAFLRALDPQDGKKT